MVNLESKRLLKWMAWGYPHFMKTGFGIIWVCLKQDSPKFDDESDESDESSNSDNVVAIWLPIFRHTHVSPIV